MKLGKEKEAKKTSGQDKVAAPAKAKLGLTSPSLYITLAAVAGVAAVALTGLLLHALLLAPGLTTAETERNQALLSAVATVFDQKLNDLQASVKHYADQIPPVEFSISREQVDAIAMRALPGSLRVVSFPLGLATRDEAQPLPVSFASLDLIRSVEQNGKGRLEAFVLEDKWYIQVVMPVQGAGGQVAGTLLAMFGADVLKPNWNALPKGQVELLQNVSGSPRPVLTSGQGGGERFLRDTGMPGWSVAYTPAVGTPALVDATTYWILIAVGAVLAGGLVAAVVLTLLKTVRRDVGLVSGYVRLSLQGEKPTAPKIKLDLLHSMVVLVQQTRKAPPKAAAPAAPKAKAAAGSAAKGKPGKPAKAAAAEDELGEAEPLFQGDSLDIDMLGEDEDLLGLNEEDLGLHGDSEFEVNEGSLIDVDEEIFRAYDIRGVVDKNLSPQIMQEIGKALGSEAYRRGIHSLCVGYDGRYSSPDLAQSLMQGILSTGVSVINVGMVPTPVLYFATHHLETGSGAMVTGSHNPSNYNGIKMMLGGDTLAQDDIQILLKRIKTQNYVRGQGERSEVDVRQDYIDAVVGDIAVAAPLKVVVDAGNGVAGELGPKLIEELGCEVIPLYCEIDGRFPNHHPDPGKPENLRDLINKVVEVGADLGIAFDGDGDRIGVVTGEGKIIWPDRLLMLFAKDVVSRNPGADVIFDVKCSRRLNGLISSVGGRPVMWRTGHSLIKAKMKETGALLAGEMSGHIFFKERWLGFDDGLYSAARLLEILGIDERDADRVFEEFPEDISTPELNVEVGEAAKFKIIEQLSGRGAWGDANVSTIDGVRVEYSDGWGLCRASNTTPMLVLRFEAETEDALERIQETFRTQLLAIDSSMQLPF